MVPQGVSRATVIGGLFATALWAFHNLALQPGDIAIEVTAQGHHEGRVTLVAPTGTGLEVARAQLNEWSQAAARNE